MKFNKKQLLDGEKRLFQWLKKGTGNAGYLTLTDMEGKKQRLYQPQYAGLYESMNMFRLNNCRDPNYVTLVSKANNSLVFDRQNNAYNCCPTSLSMASQMLYHYKSEQECAKALGTSTSGTAPDQLINGAKKLGFNVVPIKRNKDEVKKSLDKGYPVIAHFQTNQTKQCKGDYIGSFGHYALIWSMTSTEYVIADPSKSVNRKYRFSCLDNANKGYRENYYSIRPL